MMIKKDFNVPELNFEWAETLLTFYLYKDPDNFQNHEAHQKKLANKFKRNSAPERYRVNFRNNRKINSLLNFQYQ